MRIGPFIRRALIVVLSVCVAAIYIMQPASVRLPKAAAANIASNRPLRVLFVGNSLTYVNDLPRMVEAMAAARPHSRPLITGMVAFPAETLKGNWRRGDALRAIRDNGYWDYVVLQEQSHGPMDNPELMSRYAKTFDAEIRKGGAKTMLYMTWGDENAPENMERIAKSYSQVGETLGATVVPVGRAFGAALAGRPGERLYGADGHHPSVAGTYLAAAVFYDLIEGENPEGIPGSLRLPPPDGRMLADLPADEAAYLWGVAAKTVGPR